jgi:hypothetical protein
MNPGQTSPFILCQPRPTLQTLFPGPQYAKELSLLEERTYVGIIGDSLFAMSHANFPLVSVDYRFSASRPIGNGPTDYGKDVGLPIVERECTAYGCLVGTRASRGDSASSRFSRLIEAKPPRLLIDGPAGAMTNLPLSLPGGESSSLWSEYGMQSIMLALCAIICATLASGAITGYAQFWNRRSKLRATASPKVEADMRPVANVVASTPVAKEQEQVKSKLAVAFADPPPKIAANEGSGDHSDGEGEGDEEGEESRRRRRRRRSKKKAKGDPNGVPTAADEPGNVAASDPVEANSPQTQSSEKEDYIVVPVPGTELTDPPAAPTSVPESPNSSLMVSDVILGQFSSSLSYGSHC